MDLLGRLEANGTIDAAMRDAGRIFHALFRAAALDPLRAAPLVRLPAGTGETLTERQAGRPPQGRWRRWTRSAAWTAPQAPASWHVVGCGCSIREWAARRGWSGRPVGHAQAQGMLVAALGVLAAHFRLRAPAAPSSDRPA